MQQLLQVHTTRNPFKDSGETLIGLFLSYVFPDKYSPHQIMRLLDK